MSRVVGGTLFLSMFIGCSRYYLKEISKQLEFIGRITIALKNKREKNGKRKESENQEDRSPSKVYNKKWERRRRCGLRVTG